MADFVGPVVAGSVTHHFIMLAACLCFRDSAPYLQEWLLFHWVQGIRRFYLYDNGSTDDYRQILQPWIDASIVRLRLWPGLAQQQLIYDHCLSTAGREVDWLAFIDDDEFLFNPVGRPLPDILKTFQEHAGVAAAWILYGSSGHLQRNEDWIIDRFVRRAPNPDVHVKCIVQPGLVTRSKVIGHMFEARPGFHIVDEHGRPLAEPLTSASTITQLRINHYLVKSWDEFRPRRTRPQANTGQPTPHILQQWQKWDLTWNEVEDPVARQFIPTMQRTARQLSTGRLG